MYHVMISKSDNDVVIAQDDQIEQYKKNGYRLYSGSSNEKTAKETVGRLRTEGLPQEPSK